MTNLFNNKEIRALSWKQPFATLMAHGKIETRTWYTSYRGLVLICASKKEYGEKKLIRIAGLDQYNRINQVVKEVGQDKILEGRGHALYVAELVDCRQMTIHDQDQCFVQYDPILYCHIYKNVRAIKPIPWKGTLGWKVLDPDFINQIEFIGEEYVYLSD